MILQFYVPAVFFKSHREGTDQLQELPRLLPTTVTQCFLQCKYFFT